MKMRDGGASTGSVGQIINTNIDNIRIIRSYGYESGISYVFRRFLFKIKQNQ